MSEVCIISVIYEEPEWEETERLVLNAGAPVFFVDREGVGSLAKAINAGFSAFGKDYKYCWFVTNITFGPTCFPNLIKEMKNGWAALTPAFKSDHKLCRPGEGVRTVPFVEFTAPIVRSDVLLNFPLDEQMPYWGHDFDWGYRVRQAGHKLGCLATEIIDHVYIRNSKDHPVTKARLRQRKRYNMSTGLALKRKYGKDYKKVLS
jgi:GT2 family glycosyltransferase